MNPGNGDIILICCLNYIYLVKLMNVNVYNVSTSIKYIFNPYRRDRKYAQVMRINVQIILIRHVY